MFSFSSYLLLLIMKIYTGPSVTLNYEIHMRNRQPVGSSLSSVLNDNLAIGPVSGICMACSRTGLIGDTAHGVGQCCMNFLNSASHWHFCHVVLKPFENEGDVQAGVTQDLYMTDK